MNAWNNRADGGIRPLTLEGASNNATMGFSAKFKALLLSAGTALFCSITAVAVGVALVVTVSIQASASSSNSKNKISPAIDYASAQTAWMDLRTSLQLVDTIVLHPEAPQAKALQWLAMHYQSNSSTLSTSNKLDYRERYALAAIYYHWEGPLWNFLPDDHAWLSVGGDGNNECQWEGLECNEDGTTVTTLNLTNMGRFAAVYGRIPSEIGLLTGLQVLAVPERGLQGAVPSSLEALTNLREIDLRLNRLTSFFHPEMDKLSNMQYLRISSNQLDQNLTTDIQEALRHWTSLRVFQVQSNARLVSNRNIWNTTFVEWNMLEALQVTDTLIESVLPDEIGRLTHLVLLELSRVPLTGTLPTSMGHLTRLEQLAVIAPTLPDVGLRGTLPTEIGNLEKLVFMAFDNNLFDTTLPTELGQLTELEVLSMENLEGLHGPIPTELGLLGELGILQMSGVSLTGTLPTELGLATGLHRVVLHNSDLTGTVPSGLYHLGYELTLDCAFNEGFVDTAPIQSDQYYLFTCYFQGV